MQSPWFSFLVFLIKYAIDTKQVDVLYMKQDVEKIKTISFRNVLHEGYCLQKEINKWIVYSVLHICFA